MSLDSLRRLQAGDSRALADLYDRYTPVLYSVALRIVGSASDAEDVIQQTWTQAWKSAKRYDPRRGSVTSWLLNMARSRALDRIRSLVTRRKAEGAAQPAPEGGGGDPAASLEAMQRHRRVREALRGLGDDQRRVLEMAYFEGLAQSEIAQRLEKPLGTVKSWTRRGLEQLRGLLAEEGQS